MNLVIVESPTKARTIGRYLGNDYTIKASMGHVVDLPKSKLSVDVDHDFLPQYELIPDKAEILEDLKKAAKKASSIILATDPDREGEAIASHVKDALGSSLKFTRIVFHEITKEAIDEALKNPRAIDSHLVDAQTARRVLDRLVGYKLSPLLWQKVRRGLSAGRVQSVALRLIVEREREMEKFKKENYFTIHAILVPFRNTQKTQKSSNSDYQTVRQSDSPSFPSVLNKNETEFELIEINGEKIENVEKFNLYDGEYSVTKTIINNEEKAKKIVDDLKSKHFVVADVLQKEVTRSPQPPFTTSTLQQEASRRLGFFGKRTMSLAQKLYEEGFITYHRTDSVNLAQSAVASLRAHIKKEIGEKYLPDGMRFYKNKQKLAQEAHEAIRPTKVNVPSIQVGKELGRDFGRLYDLIWKRAVASQMKDAVIESTTVVVDAIQNTQNTQKTQSTRISEDQKSQNIRGSDHTDPPAGGLTHRNSDSLSVQSFPEYRLKASGSVLVFEGFLKINPLALQDKKLPEFKASEDLSLLSADALKHETPPPPRYNDASLIKTLEEKGIGRPSTYAAIISTIQERHYVEREEGRFTPTSVGVAVNDFLVANFSDVDDIPFTAQMEDQLDNVAHGQEDWVRMMKDFYKPFAKKLDEVKGVKRVQIEVEKTMEKCDKCGAPMVVRIGRFGKFLSCSKFPKCDFSKAFIEETKFICPKDNGKIIVRKTRKGRRFYGCSNYPACKFAAWKLEDIKGTGEARP